VVRAARGWPQSSTAVRCSTMAEHHREENWFWRAGVGSMESIGGQHQVTNHAPGAAARYVEPLPMHYPLSRL
jgi:hypothetical protein